MSKETSLEPYMEDVIVTPEMAAELLTKNTSNRALRQTQVAQLADIMISGRYQFNAEPIRIDRNGVLIDGQHRLHAVFESEVPTRFIIWHNLDPEVVHVTDIGIKRTLNDALKMHGETSVSALAAIVAIVYYWRDGLRGQYLFTPNWNPEYSIPQIPDLLRFFQENREELKEATRHSSLLRTRLKLTPRVGGLSWVVLTEVDAEDAQAFFDKLSKGDGLAENDPIFLLREKLLAEATSTQRRYSTQVTLGLIFKAWNFWRDGAKIQRLNYSPGGKTPEGFPEPH